MVAQETCVSNILIQKVVSCNTFYQERNSFKRDLRKEGPLYTQSPSPPYGDENFPLWLLASLHQGSLSRVIKHAQTGLVFMQLRGMWGKNSRHGLLKCYDNRDGSI